jgi:hypothetical protein
MAPADFGGLFEAGSGISVGTNRLFSNLCD